MEKDDDFRKYYDIEKEEIGEGSFGRVYKATNKITKELRAIKVIDLKKMINNYKNNGKPLSDKDLQDIIISKIKEIKIMEIMEGENHQNKNTVKLYEYYYIKNTEIAIVMELCDENLAIMIGQRQKKPKFDFDEIKNILHQLNNSFRIFHKYKIAHRDLKPLNILVKYENKNDRNNYTIKLCDYGEAKRLTMTKNLFSTVVGTINFIAPEILERDKFDLKCDLWSLGIIIYYLYFGKLPYDGEGELAYFNQINNYGQEIIDESGNEDFDDLIRKLLIKEQKNRITWEEYFNHPFLKLNQILISLKVYKKDIDNYKKGEKQGIYFLNNLNNENSEISNLTNEDCDLFINGIKTDFKFSLVPEKEDDYEIKLVFKKKLTNCSYMFSNCDNIIKIDLSSFDSSQVTNMKYMFGKCHFLEEINLSNLDTSKVTNMSYLFNKCSTLKKINFPETFNTNNVEDMSFMFHCCFDLVEINFPNCFVTKKVKNMETMFAKCYNLKKLDLRNFETNEAINIGYMFEDCVELKELLIDQNKFKTDKVIFMGKMFSNCSNLENLNINKFSFSNVKYMDHMFENCEKLKEIDLSELNDLNDEININEIFENLKDVSVKANLDIIDKFKTKFKDIKFITI